MEHFTISQIKKPMRGNGWAISFRAQEPFIIKIQLPSTKDSIIEILMRSKTIGSFITVLIIVLR